MSDLLVYEVDEIIRNYFRNIIADDFVKQSNAMELDEDALKAGARALLGSLTGTTYEEREIAKHILSKLTRRDVFLSYQETLRFERHRKSLTIEPNQYAMPVTIYLDKSTVDLVNVLLDLSIKTLRPEDMECYKLKYKSLGIRLCSIGRQALGIKRPEDLHLEDSH